MYHNHFFKDVQEFNKAMEKLKKLFHLFPFFILQLRSQDHNEDNKPTRFMPLKMS